MGTFTTKLKVWNPSQPEKVEEIEVWVDTGAAFSWVLRSRLTALGIKPLRQMPFRTIQGNVIQRELAAVYVGVDGYQGPDTVVMAEPGEMEVMGAHSIEGLGLAADPVQKRLVPTVLLAL